MAQQNRRPETVRIARYVSMEEETVRPIREFTEGMGRAISRVGKVYSVGSMALTVVGGTELRRSINRMTNKDRSKIDMKSMAKELDARLKEDRPRAATVEVQGLGLYGEALRRGKDVHTARLALTLLDSEIIDQDVECVQSYLSDNKIPEIRVPSDKRWHITFGDIFIKNLITGEGENPNLLVPKRLFIPDDVQLYGVSAEHLGQRY